MATLENPLTSPAKAPLPAAPQPSGGDPAAEPPSDSGRAARIGLWAIGLGFGGFLLWAGLAPIDEGVPTQGIVAIDTKRKVVQHLSGGIVKEVLVREGQIVEEGQPVIRLDEAVARANYESVRQRYLGLRAMQGRLLAEQAGSAKIDFHPDLIEASSDPLIRSQMMVQEQLLRSRRSALQADLRGLEEGVQGQAGMLKAYAGMLEHRRNQLSLVQEELRNTRELVAEGYAPRNRQLELERLVAESNASLADLEGNTIRAQRAIGELRQQKILREQEYRKEVESHLADVNREVLSDAEKFVSVKADLERIEIRSPASGQVVGLNIQTVGGVVQPGERLMDVVPEDAPLLLEARIPPHLIDRVRTGLPTDVRFSAFSHAPQLVVEGKVVSVSHDLLTEQQGGMTSTYYLARVEVTPDGRQSLGERQMQPGMPAEIVIRTGERSLLTYLLHPLTKRIAASMTEE